MSKAGAHGTRISATTCTARVWIRRLSFVRARLTEYATLALGHRRAVTSRSRS